MGILGHTWSTYAYEHRDTFPCWARCVGSMRTAHAHVEPSSRALVKDPKAFLSQEGHVLHGAGIAW